MAGTGQENTGNGSLVAEKSRALGIATEGIRTGEEFANLMSALMSDVIEQRISPQIANAAVNAGGKLLKVVEMQYKYGSQEPARKTPAFVLAPGSGS